VPSPKLDCRMSVCVFVLAYLCVCLPLSLSLSLCVWQPPVLAVEGHGGGSRGFAAPRFASNLHHWQHLLLVACAPSVPLWKSVYASTKAQTVSLPCSGLAHAARTFAIPMSPVILRRGSRNKLRACVSVCQSAYLR